MADITPIDGTAYYQFAPNALGHTLTPSQNVKQQRRPHKWHVFALSRYNWT